MRGEYDANRNYCLVALALQKEGVIWQAHSFVSRKGSRKAIVPREYEIYRTTTDVIVVNPRQHGEVMISAKGELKFYCTNLTKDAVRLVLWSYITG